MATPARAIVIVGEIGGGMEEAAAEYAKGVAKPMVAFIAGAAAPRDKKMGHAGAIVTGNAGSYAGKRAALESAGVVVVDTPSQIAAAVAAGIGAGRAGGQTAASRQVKCQKLCDRRPFSTPRLNKKWDGRASIKVFHKDLRSAVEFCDQLGADDNLTRATLVF